MDYNELIRHPEIYAEVQNALIIGMSESKISSTYELPVSTIKTIQERMQQSVKMADDWTENKRLDDLLADLITENTRALRQIAKQALDPGYTLNQKAGDLGNLYEKIGQFTIRLLEAAAEAKNK